MVTGREGNESLRAPFLAKMRTPALFFHHPAFRTAASLALLVLLWFTFAPVQFGGQVSYVIVNGNSMLPTLEKGDLVLLRQASYYQTGDVVTYRYPGVGPVIHRIVAQEIDGRYVIKGDHNSWVDAYHPTAQDLMGVHWFTLPGAGRLLGQLRTPWALAGFAGLGVLVMGLTLKPSQPGRRTHQRRAWLRQHLSGLGAAIAGRQDVYFVGLYVLGLLGLALGVFAFTRPLTRQAPDNLSYQQVGYYHYSADLPGGVYDENRLQTGDVIYPQINCKVDLSFDYVFLSQSNIEIQGVYQLVATLSDASGWHRNLPLQERKDFSSANFHAAQQLDLCAVQQIIDQKRSVTGVAHSQYFLTLQPNVTVNASLDGRPLQDNFSPQLILVLEPQQVFPLKESSSGQDPFSPTKAGLLAGVRTEANTLTLLGLVLPVDGARWLALLLVLVAAGGLAIPAYLTARPGRVAARVHSRFLLGPLLVEARGGVVRPGDQVIDIASLEDLARVAERMATIILFYNAEGWLNYLVRDGQTVYRYRQEASKEVVAGEPGLRRELLDALQTGEFVLHYQPVVSLETGCITQVEALLRWQHPRRGLLTPPAFLPAAEGEGLTGLIDTRTIELACAQLNAWQQAGYPAFPLAINLSALQLSQPGLDELVVQELRRYELLPSRLQIEIEASTLSEDEATIANLTALKALGVGIVISGSPDVSSLPLAASWGAADQLKLERSLVQQIGAGGALNDSVRQWIELAHSRQMRVTALGVETHEQLHFFKVHACDQVQGFLISPARPAEALSDQLRDLQPMLDLEEG